MIFPRSSSPCMTHVVSIFIVSPDLICETSENSLPSEINLMNPKSSANKELQCSLETPEMKPNKDTLDYDLGSKAWQSACHVEMSPFQKIAFWGNRSPHIIKVKTLSSFSCVRSSVSCMLRFCLS